MIGTGACQISIPAKAFKKDPIPVLTPVAGTPVSVTGLVTGFNAGSNSWYVQYYLTAPAIVAITISNQS